ncbi:MAG: hypothetical protein Q9226_002033 [Calogaya cf. arnoldii]
MAGCSKDELEYIINHVVLPPKLPHEPEDATFVEAAEKALVNELHSTLQRFLQQCGPEFKPAWSVVQRMLMCWFTTQLFGDLSVKLLTKAVLAMGPGDALPVRVRAQNAAIIFRRAEDVVSLECFELSSRSADVMSCKGSLRRTFPAHAVALPQAIATDRNFCRELFTSLKKMNTEVVHQMMPKSRKAGQNWSEFRDTCNPGLVSELLMATVAAMGTPVETLQIRKRIRDDVVWDRSELPWRRSTLWLILRIAIHTTLLRSMEPNQAHAQFKNFTACFMTDLLRLTADRSIALDTSKCLQMKIVRRLFKLGVNVLPFVQKAALVHTKEATERQSQVWLKIQEKDARRQTDIDVSSLEQDTRLTLFNCRPALDTALHEVKHDKQPSVEIPTDYRDWMAYNSDGLPCVNEAKQSRPEGIFALSQYEHWVGDSLASWLDTALVQPTAAHCTSIHRSAEYYRRLASQLYSSSPQLFSVMLLTLGDLWYALDRIAGSVIPLLHRYSPELAADVFDVLMLPKMSQMQRLQRLQTHIKARHQNVQPGGSSIFADPSSHDRNCFVSKYFDQSVDHQTLRQTILADADTLKEDKTREWRRKTDQYNALASERDRLSCSTMTNYHGDTVHNLYCRKCDVKKEIKSLSINVFEWPLPENETQSRLAVVHLRCPEAFAAWQNLTWVLVNDLGRGANIVGSSPAGHLSTYTGLAPYYSISNSRLDLAATTKSVTVSHYRAIGFPVDLDNVFSEHGLHYKLYDCDRSCWVNEQQEQPSYTSRCRLSLPEGPYHNLQYAVDSTLHSQNEVLAAQTECSPDLSIHEYIAFGSLRADGEQTQWLNICRELRASTLSWNTESICTLIKQSAWQACSIGTTILRTAHKLFESTHFTAELLSNLEIVLESIQANRQCHHTMEVLIILILRTVSLAVDSSCLPRCFDLLQQCRSVLFLWAHAAEVTLRLATDPKEILDIRCSLLTLTMLCKLTFDVDICYCSRVLTTSDHLLYWTSASMIIRDNTPGTESELPPSIRRALLYDTQLSYRYYKQVHQLCNIVGNDGLDRAIHRVWSAFQSLDDVWVPLVQGETRWISKQTLARSQSESQKVSYNVLSGELLVDGRPLGLLPKDYTSHHVFIRLFGAQILRISTSDMAGMQYMTAGEEHGYRFHFDLRGSDLIIRAKTASTVLELIPHMYFVGDFPTVFVEDHVHWFDITTSEVEFRPLHQRWVTDINNWRLSYRSQGDSVLHNVHHRLVDVRSRTCECTVSVFGCLETSMFTHITRSSTGKLHIFLPRFGFQFVGNEDGELECQELRKIVDQDQSLGTLVGLKNRLVLCARGDRSKKLDRLVLVPEGTVSTRLEESHVSVHISTSGRNVHCFRFRHDPIMRRLDGGGSVVSRLYQAYLHALTSFILPDSLTGYLGMECSLNILKEQVYRCCKPLTPAEMSMLNLIASLTPRRTFYPAHEKAMQQVTWHRDMSSLVQNGAFWDIAQKILAHSEQFIKFYRDLEPVPPLESRGDEQLLQRAKFRQCAFLNIDYGGDVRTAEHDKDYDARDLIRDSEAYARVFSMSSYVSSWTGDMVVTPNLAPLWTSWGTVAGFGCPFDFSQAVADLLGLNLAFSWGSLYEFCRTCTRESSLYKLLFLFAQISYRSKLKSLNDLKTLLAFATNQALRGLPDFPSYGAFTLRNGSDMNLPELRSAIGACVKPFEVSSKHISAAERRQEHAAYKRLSSANVETAVGFYNNQWPCRQPTQLSKSSVKWLNITAVKQCSEDLFAEWFKNRECQRHLATIRPVIESTMTSSIAFPFAKSTWRLTVVAPRHECSELLQEVPRLMETRYPDAPGLPFVLRDQQHVKALERNSILRLLVTGFGAKSEKKNQSLRSRYKMDLIASLDALQRHLETVRPNEIPPADSIKAMLSLDRCQKHCERVFELLCSQLQPEEPIEDLLKTVGLWPRLCMRDLLALTATTSSVSIPEEWKESVIAIGRGVTAFQRARRLVLAIEKADTLSFFQEMANPGQSGWNANDKPDWLLIEIENDILIRPVQVRVAMEMIQPSNLSNTLMQLNMDTLTQRLGGLVNRPVYFMPFSRKTNIDLTITRQMQTMYADCMAKGGVLIVQPEHILSFKLMGIERVASEDHGLGTELMRTQAWLDDNCRDVLDESDEILDVKFQLIYTLGAQRNMDGQPDRWLMMQGVFDIVQNQAWLLQAQHPHQIEVEKRTPGSFPSIRLLSVEVRNALISGVGEGICQSKVAGLVMSNLPLEVSEAVINFVTVQDVVDADCKTIQSFFTNNQFYLKRLLFVRGLIACGILLHILHDKRWSVTYGLHPIRCLCAVPYRAKGVPAPTAEFGHPDVAIALTCLSYYYTGLTDDQLKTVLEILQKADDPSFEYGTWTARDRSFPKHLQRWTAVNLEDHRQCSEELFPALSFNKKVADFFMTNVVFPKEGKEFDQKLSTSGWDIPAKPDSKQISTGFSGTNDNRFLLPSSISQNDLPELRHTSAKVLEFLLRPENLSYTCAKDEKGCQLSSQGLLEAITRVDSNVRVLIDVGAQILDLSNEEVISHWLALNANADAGVFFSSDDHAMVIDRDGRKEPLMTSSFANRMDRCVVYLDDVHTRACMRLRQLGQGQSLMYVASPEVHHNIVETTSASPTGELTGRNVIEWALEQSCLQIERNQPLRVVQGLSYYQRQQALEALKQQLLAPDSDESIPVNDLGDAIIEHEAQSLHDLYAPDAMRNEKESDLVKSSRSKSAQAVQELIDMWDHIDPSASRHANMHEELEREVGHEVEQETQIERPPRATPEERKIDPRLVLFIRTGTLSLNSTFSSVFKGVLAKSSTNRLLRTAPWQRLYVTSDFVRTIQVKKTKGSEIGVNDDYLRPVHWLLVSKSTTARGVVLIMSQYEINQFLDLIQAPSSRVTLISYEPRVTRSMPSLDSSPIKCLPGAQEAWDTVPQILRQELHLFAGQLYFTTFEEYQLLVEALEAKDSISLSFLREWIGIRRKGQNYLQTHVGQVISGRVLHKDMFETSDEDTVMAGVE